MGGASGSIHASFILHMISFLPTLTLKVHTKYARLLIPSPHWDLDALLLVETSIAASVFNNIPLCIRSMQRDPDCIYEPLIVPIVPFLPRLTIKLHALQNTIIWIPSLHLLVLGVG